METEAVVRNDVQSLVRTRFDRLDDAIRAGDIVGVRALARAVREEYVVAHDGFRDAIAASISRAVDASTPDEGEALARRVVEVGLQGGDPPQYAQSGLAERLKAIATGWHWHATSFTLSEDDEKFTFHLGPCGSGMRLLLEGHYDGDGAWHRSQKPSPSNFLQTGFPMYSNHCAEMTRMALMNGSATFIVEGWTPMRSRGLCIQHTFKDLSAVPAEFYERVGLNAPPTQKRVLPEGNRLFTQEELDELATHPLDRLVRRLEKGDGAGALATLGDCRRAWQDSIHDIYRLWLGRLWSEIERALGHAEFARAIEITGPELIKGVEGRSPIEWAAFWSIHLRLNEIRRTADGWDFIVGAESLLEPDEFPSYPRSIGEFCDALNRGIWLRHWTESGFFENDGETLVHHLPAATR
jgi:hypothetical protein